MMRPDYIYAARLHGPVSAVAAAQKCMIKPGALILHHFMYLDDGLSALPLDGRAPVHTPAGRAPCRGQGGSRAHVAPLFLIDSDRQPGAARGRQNGRALQTKPQAHPRRGDRDSRGLAEPACRGPSSAARRKSAAGTPLNEAMSFISRRRLSASFRRSRNY